VAPEKEELEPEDLLRKQLMDKRRRAEWDTIFAVQSTRMPLTKYIVYCTAFLIQILQKKVEREALERRVRKLLFN
jgi:hypothetical protein